jgi:excisionase family DNA binding protein
MNDLLTIKEIADRYRVKRDTIYRWIKAGMPSMKGPGKGGKGRVMFDPAKTDLWMESAK